MYLRKKAVAGMLFLNFWAISCGDSFEFVPTKQCEKQNEKQQSAFATPILIWQKERVGVCWKNMTESNRPFAAFVQQEVTKYWDSKIELDFVGWEECGANNSSNDIKIAITDERSWSVTGSLATLATTSMSLNFSFKNFAQKCSASEAFTFYCVGYTAIHEFGHALGLDHEQNRPDTPESCANFVEVQKPFFSSRAYGEWDDKSVMNYCSSAYEPSCKDIAAVQDMYGPESDNTARLIIGQ